MNDRPRDEAPRIVVGVDGFESSRAALRWAIHQAKLTGAVVEAVTVARPGDVRPWCRPGRRITLNAVTSTGGDNHASCGRL